MPKQLKNLSVREVSGVDRAANKRTFLMAKSAMATPPLKGDNPMAKPNAVAVALAKALAPMKKSLPAGAQALLAQLTAAPAGDETPDLVDYTEDQQSDATLEQLCDALYEAIDDLSDAETDADKREAFEALLEQFGEAVASSGMLKAAGILKAGRKISSSNLSILQQIDTLIDQLITNAGGDPAQTDADDEQATGDGVGDDGSDDDTEPEQGDVQMARKAARAAKKTEREKARKEKQPMAKSAEFISLEKRLVEAERIAKQEQETRLKGEFLQKARDIGGVPGMSFEDMAETLRKADPATSKLLEKQFRASAEVLKKSGLLKEFGTNRAGGTMDAMAEIEAKADDLMKSDSKLSKAAAIAKATEQNPDLYARHQAEKRSA